MKIKKEFIILAVIVAALVVYLVFNAGNKGNLNYKLPTLTRIKEQDIDKIEIITSAIGKLALAFDRGEDLWRISPQDYLVDNNKIDQMVKHLTELELPTLISDKQTYEKYELDQANKITVIAYKGDEIVRNLDIGKVSDISDHTFVKLADSDDTNVYEVNMNLKNTFDHTIDDLRDKVVLEVDKDSIREISLIFEDQDILLTKSIIPENENEAEKIIWDIAGQEKKADTYEVTTMLNSLTNLVCDSYVPENEQVDFSNPYFKMVLKGDKEYWLYTIEHNPDNDMYLAVSSENDYQFNLIGWKMNGLLKRLDTLIEEDED